MAAMLALYAGCAETVKVSRVKPAEVDVTGYRKIAVGNVTGNNGRTIAASLEQALHDSGRFEVLERSHLGMILQEQGLSRSGAVEPDETVQVGKMVGSAALIFGNVGRRDYSQKRTHEDKACGDRKRPYPCTEYVVTGTWTEQVHFKVVDTTTGKIIAMKHVARSREKQVSAIDAIPAVTWDVESVSRDLDREVVREFMTAIAPHTVWEQVHLFTDGKLPELEIGVNFAKAGQWPSAIGQFRAACEKADADPGIQPRLKARARYDLGVALGYSGSYDDGIGELEKAVRIQPEDTYVREIRRIKMFRSDAETLREQGMDSAPTTSFHSVDGG
jgi:curli biogenesis system outer membrane secretion channel CsgG